MRVDRTARDREAWLITNVGAAIGFISVGFWVLVGRLVPHHTDRLQRKVKPPPQRSRPPIAASPDDDPSPSERAGPAAGTDGRRRRIIVAFLPVGLGTIVAVGSALLADSSRIDGLGLIRTLPATWFVGVALILVGVVRMPGGAIGSRWGTVLHVAALAVCLHGLPGIVEPNPRFATAWLHVGFADHIAENGTLLKNVDARFSWAGFFAGNALLQRVADTESTLWLVRFTPVAVNLFACWGIGLLGRLTQAQPRHRLLAMTAFLILNWTGQDYFSPQAVNFCLFLVVIVTVLAAFGANPPLQSWFHRLIQPRHDPVPQMSDRARLLAYTGCLTGLMAIALSHQLTPFFLAGALLVLSIARRTTLRTIGVTAAVITIAWIVFAATPYWIGHLGKLTGEVGEVGAAVNKNVGVRTSGGGADHQIVVGFRIGLTLLCWVVSGLALLHARLRRRTPLVWLCLFVVPAPMVALQPYGGEMFIRILLFSLPAVCLIVAELLDKPLLRGATGRAVVTLALVACVPAFVLARFGNESFEQVTTNDRKVLESVYREAPDNTFVYIANYQTVIKSERVRGVDFRGLGDLSTVEAITAQLDSRKAAETRPAVYVLLTEAQAAYGEQVERKPPGWMEEVTRRIQSSGRFRTVRTSGTSAAFEYVGQG